MFNIFSGNNKAGGHATRLTQKAPRDTPK